MTIQQKQTLSNFISDTAPRLPVADVDVLVHIQEVCVGSIENFKLVSATIGTTQPSRSPSDGRRCPITAAARAISGTFFVPRVLAAHD